MVYPSSAECVPGWECVDMMFGPVCRFIGFCGDDPCVENEDCHDGTD